MNETELHSRLQASGIAGIGELDETGRDPRLNVDAGSLVEVMTFLRDDPDCAMEMLHCVTAVDREEAVDVVYHVNSLLRHHSLTVAVSVPKPEGAGDDWHPEVPSVTGVYTSADWHEREQWDLLGVRFTGHPDPRRILLPEEWIGHPLRKEYVYPTDHGEIPLELDATPIYERDPDTPPKPSEPRKAGEPLMQGASAPSTRPHAGGKAPEPEKEGES